MKRILVIVLCVLLLAGCAKKDLSGEYSLAEYKQLNLSGGEKIMITDSLFSFVPIYASDYCLVALGADEQMESFSASYDEGSKLATVPFGETVTISFTFDKAVNTQTGIEIIAPTVPEFDESYVFSEGEDVIFCTVTNLYDITLTPEEIQGNLDSLGYTDPLYDWYNAMLYSDNAVLVADSAGSEAYLFTSQNEDKPLNIGDRIAVRGFVDRCAHGDFINNSASSYCIYK